MMQKEGTGSVSASSPGKSATEHLLLGETQSAYANALHCCRFWQLNDCLYAIQMLTRELLPVTDLTQRAQGLELIRLRSTIGQQCKGDTACQIAKQCSQPAYIPRASRIQALANLGVQMAHGQAQACSFL